LSALSPAPLPPFDFNPPSQGRIHGLPQEPVSPPRGGHDFLQEFRVPVTPGSSPGPRRRAPLDIAGFITGPRSVSPATSSGHRPWDEFSQSSPMPSGSVVAETIPPLAWHQVVDVVYNSGLVDLAHLPVTPTPTQSVIGGPVVPPKRRVALPPAPLALASVDNAVRACWGGDWPSAAQHQPPPPNAALHPNPSVLVPGFKPRFHPTTRNWLQLQPVGLRSDQGLFGPASAAVPELLRQSAPVQSQARRGSQRPRPRQQRPATATHTSAAAAAPVPAPPVTEPRRQNRA